MLCVFLLLCALHLPKSPTPFDVVHYSLTPSNRENWNGFSRCKFTVSVVSSIAVQLCDNSSEIWSSIILFRGEIAIIQVFDEDISSLQLPCFPVECLRSTTFPSTLLWYFDFFLRRIFVQSLGTLPWEITKYLIDGRTFWSNRNDPYAGIWTTQKGRPSVQAVSRCSRPNLLTVFLTLPAFISTQATRVNLYARTFLPFSKV